MSMVTLTGRWVAPDLSARQGRVIATLVDPTVAPAGVIGSAVGYLDVNGALPTAGTDALRVTAPSSGTATYVIRERLVEVDEVQYRITVTAADSVIDLTTR